MAKKSDTQFKMYRKWGAEKVNLLNDEGFLF